MRFDRWEKLWDYPLIIVVVDHQHHHPDNDHIMLQGWAARVKKTKEQTITGLPTGLSKGFDVLGTQIYVANIFTIRYDMTRHFLSGQGRGSLV